DLAAMLGNVEPQDRRHRHLLRRQRAEGVLDAGDRLHVERDEAAQFPFGQDGHPAHAASSLAKGLSPQTICRCSPMSTFLPDRIATVGPCGFTRPAISAAMPTAAAPSTISRSFS